MPTAAQIQTDLDSAYALRSAALRGETVIELWRDGRRVRKQVPAIGEINDMIRQLEQELESAQLSEAGKPRRRAISLAYRN